MSSKWPKLRVLGTDFAMGFKGSSIVSFLPNYSLSFPLFISLGSWRHQLWLSCSCLPIFLLPSHPNLTSCLWMSHLCSLPTVSLWLSPFHPARVTFCSFLLQHCKIQNSYLWLRNHSFLERVCFFVYLFVCFLPQQLFIWLKAIRGERWEGKWNCQEVFTPVFSCSEELKLPREMLISFCLAVLYLNSTGDIKTTPYFILKSHQALNIPG